MKAFLVIPCLLLAANVLAQSQEYNGEFAGRGTTRTDRIIVQWKDASGIEAAGAKRIEKMRQLSAKTGSSLQAKERIAARSEVLQLDKRLSGDELRKALEAIASDPDIEFAAPDLRRHAHALPNDTLISEQWYFLSNEISALRAESAWDVTTGSDGTVVAVLDTGVRFDHPDLLRASEGGKLLPGYDFVAGSASNGFLAANDGDGRDSDPTDPGDWVSESDLSEPGFDDCEVRSSSWHGTRVAAVIAARTNNNEGVAGAGWNTWILPVRVLGKCGGFDSDIIAAARWAAGLSVPGVPDNPYPANIINMSLGGDRSCTAAYQSMASELTALGVLIVASAGNDGGPVSAPASCTGVLGVAAVRQAGTKVGFSNLGPSVDIAAPGGNCVNVGPGQPCLFSIVTATNLGSTTPTLSGYTDQFNFNVGTSFSAPLVSGTAALMHAVNARLGPQQLTARMRQSATPFPATGSQTIPTCTVPLDADDLQISECYCTTSTCGAGIVNADSAVAQALRPSVAVPIPGSIAPGQSVTFNGATSAAACGRTIEAFQWSVVDSTGTPPALASTNESSATVLAPATGQFTLRLTVTDNQGAHDSADITVTANGATTTAASLIDGPACPMSLDVQDETPPPPSPPPQAPSPPAAAPRSGGGGGQLGWELLFFALAVRMGAKRHLTGR